MKAGKLRHRVEIQQPVTSLNGSGGHDINSWLPIPGGQVWAEIQPLSSREIYQNGVMSQSSSHEITIRYLVGVSAKCRVVVNEGGRVFQITGVKLDEKLNLNLKLTCEEILVGATP